MLGTRAILRRWPSPTRRTATGAIGRNSSKGVKRSSRFSPEKWAKEIDYRLIKEVWGFRENRMAVRFAYEWHDDSGHWFRSYGNELWEFDENGLMRRRIASINDLPIVEGSRKYHWPLGRRPDGYAGLSELGL
jgi:nuclear transport factor 2 (NTF2) superfamily protein